METKKLLPIEVENQKEMFGGWSWNSGDMWSEIPEVEIIVDRGGYDWGDFWRDFNPGNEYYPDYGGGGGSVVDNGDNNGGGDDHRLKNDVPDPCRQYEGTGECTLLALDVISNYFGGDKMGINKDDFVESIGYDFGSSYTEIYAGNKGVKEDELKSMLDNFFINESVSDTQSMIDSLDNDRPILGVMHTGPFSAHAVVITGYNSSTNMVTMKDPMEPGGEKIMEYDASIFLSKTSISGFKDNDIVKRYKKDTNDWWVGCVMMNPNGN